VDHNVIQAQLADRVSQEITLLSRRLDQIEPDFRPENPKRDRRESTAAPDVDHTKRGAGRHDPQDRQAREELALHEAVDRVARHEVDDAVAVFD
jgi:hypothetical protein